MKLFLASQWLLPTFRHPFAELVGKPLRRTKVVLIENAADDEPTETWWMKSTRTALVDTGMVVTQLDLRSFAGHTKNAKLREILGAADVIWVGGGNTFYLNWLLADSGTRKIIIELVADGKIYAGDSAGAIVAGPTIAGFEEADDASFAPKQVLDGMALTDVVVMPHWGGSHYGPAMEHIAAKLTSTGYKIQLLTDAEALIIDGSKQQLLKEPKA